MKRNQSLVFLLLLSISGSSLNCRLSPAAGGAEPGPRVQISEPPGGGGKTARPLKPIEEHPDPIKFGGLDLRDAVRAFKQKFGADLKIREMTIEPGAVTILPYGTRDFTGEYRYENGGVSELTANNQFPTGPKPERAAYEAPDEAGQPVKKLSYIEHFRIDEIPLARLPEVARIAQKQVWIEGGAVKKIVITRQPLKWSVTVAGTRSEITHRFKVTEELTTVFDQDIEFERRVNVNVLTADELRQRIERIEQDFGGELKLLHISITQTSIRFTAQNPRKPEEFNEHTYLSDGQKYKPRAVPDSTIRSEVRDAKELNPKVRGAEDLLFTPADFDFGSLPQIAEKSLDELKLEKSTIVGISMRRGEYHDYDGGALKGEINIDGDNQRRSGFVRFDVNGKILKAEKR